MGMNWEDVIAHALTLPDTVEGSHYGDRAVKVASNGRAFIAPGREADSFCLLIDLDTVEMLKETDPDTFYQTAHYVGWPAVLVRFATDDPARVRAMIERARNQAATKKPTRTRKKT